jgi:hypothetical protein
MAELLTAKEHDIIWRLGSLWRDFIYIIGDGPQAGPDLDEVTIHIHALQYTVMAQAAARAYPDKYRMLGNQMED